MRCNLLPETLLLLLLCICFSSLATGKEFSERTILLEFRSWVSDTSGILSSWNTNTSSFNHCSWFGVSCDSQSRVISLSITGGGGCKGNSGTFSCSRLCQFPFHDFGITRACSHSNGRLAGKLPPLIGKLTELRVLSLAFNDLSGEIPIEIWGLEKLEILDLEGNSFTGKLPNGFSGLRNLRILNLGLNRIDGEIPVSLSKCWGLEVLNLAGNEIKGLLPSVFGNLMKLRGLYLSHNQLNGSIPGELGSKCEYLEHLDLSRNNLVGKLPASLGNCLRLKTLLVFSNMLHDTIPPDLGRLLRLQVLDVSRNRLSGLIPMELGNCVELSVLVLSNLFNPQLNDNCASKHLSGGLGSTSIDHNQFKGSIPKAITMLPKLRIVWAPGASLEGKLPSNWGSCMSLEMVNLAQNFFTGKLVGAFDRCKQLYYLNLSSNRLTGELDEKLPVPCMTVFDVSGNIMSGSIPRFSYGVCPPIPPLNYDFVEAYDLSFEYLLFFTYKTRVGIPLPFSRARFAFIHNFGGNNFSGPIPCIPVAPERLGKQIDYAFLAGGNKLDGTFPGCLFGKCGKLYGMMVNISDNRLSGHMPLGIGTTCKSLRFLDVSENQISGMITQSLGDLESLVVLDLSKNRLQGQIPVSFHWLKHLKYLSLAANNLTGVIPSGFEELRSLEVLDLSSNSLSGEIPQGLVNLRNLSALLLNNNKLSGQIPFSLGNVTSLSRFNVSFNNLSGSLPLNLINCSGALGNHFLRSCRMYSRLSDPPNNNDDSQDNAASSQGSETGDDGLKSIGIVCLASASAIISVLFVLVAFFCCSRKRIPKSRAQVSESREIRVFVDIGVPLTYENIVQATGNFNNSYCIGHGGFGSTYKAEISPGTLVAVKRLSIGRFQGIQQFHAEIKTLGMVRHPNLVTLLGYHASESEMFLIYNYLPGGNLENFIRERSARAGDWKVLHKIALDIAHALAYLHEKCTPRVLHRDVKPSNVLLDNDFNAYLSDFGLSRLLGSSESHATTGVAGTFGYVAPEYAMTCRVSDKADVYSYGVLLLELISDKKPLDPSFSSHGNGFNIVSWARMMLRQGQAKDIFTTVLWDPELQDDLSDILHLAIRCTVDSLSSRPTMNEVVQELEEIQPSQC